MSDASEEIAPSTNSSAAPGEESVQPPRRWQPIGPVERRVLGVLVEKAKTTPDVYPLTLHAITTGANQKNNRDPVMQLTAEDVEAALDRLRSLGAVGLVEGYGRVPKYRHYLYEWLGVDKVEAAVMAELLLRGPQTEGQLRAHTSRMEPIADLSMLRQILAGLKAKGLVVSLTPEGRGHVVAHTLYPAREMEQLQAQYRQAAHSIRPEAYEPIWPEMPSLAGGQPVGMPPGNQTGFVPSGLQTLQAQVTELCRQVTQLRQQIETLAQKTQHHEETLAWLRKELGF
jgi:hypothetical protein